MSSDPIRTGQLWQSPKSATNQRSPAKNATNNPFATLEGFRIKPQQGIAPKWLDEHQQMALLRAVRRGKSVRDLAMVEVMIKTGLRVSELVDLLLGDVELSERAGKVIVRAGKGGKYREVPLSKEGRVALESYLQAREEDGSQRLFSASAGRSTCPGYSIWWPSTPIKRGYRM